MRCILCLRTPDKPINIFGEEGLKLNIKNIISTHFWLQPNQEDINTELICSSCWIPVDSFHKFYEVTKEAHKSFHAMKPIVAENIVPVEHTNNNHGFNDNNIFMDQDIKVEDNDSINGPLEMQQLINPLDISIKSDEGSIGIKSDSDSEIPLSELSKQIQRKRKTSKKSHTRAKHLHKNESHLKESNAIVEGNEGKLHIQEGKWLATSYAEETYQKPISGEELDKFIKQNYELLCGVCQKPLNEFAQLHPHFCKFHDKSKPFVTCCGRKLKYRAHIVDHVLVHQIPEYFKCLECSKVWPSRRNLKEHLQTHNKTFMYHCDKCTKSFCTKIALERHQEIHLVERPFKCDECDKFYATEYRLKQHAYNMHYYKKICEQCGQIFREKATFVRHLLKHTNQPNPFFECELCGARLSSKKILQKHHKFQHQEDSIEQSCNECGIKVKSLQALKRHMNFVHKYQREHKCTMCAKAFKRALTLKEHMTTHTGEVLYTCPHCPKTFNSNANMHSHRKKMHRKEWEENRRHPHMGATTNATEENNQ